MRMEGGWRVEFSMQTLTWWCLPHAVFVCMVQYALSGSIMHAFSTHACSLGEHGMHNQVTSCMHPHHTHATKHAQQHCAWVLRSWVVFAYCYSSSSMTHIPCLRVRSN